MSTITSMDTAEDIEILKAKGGKGTVTKGDSVPGIVNALIETPARNIKIGGPVITVNITDTLPKAFRTLCNANIMGAPVVSRDGTTYEGLIAMSDLLNATLKLCDSPFRPLRFSREYLQKKHDFRTTLIKDCYKNRMAEGGAYLSVNENYSLFHVLEQFQLRPYTDRITLTGAPRKTTGMATHSMMLRFLFENKALMDAWGSTKISKLRHYHRVATIFPTRRALAAFEQMQEEKINCVAIVDLEGTLIDTISVRDLRGIGPDNLTFRFLWNTCDYFKQQVRELNLESPPEPLFVTNEGTLLDALEIMVDAKIHQVYLVDDKVTKKPVDIISVNDITRFLLDSIHDAQ